MVRSNFNQAIKNIYRKEYKHYIILKINLNIPPLHRCHDNRSGHVTHNHALLV